MIKKLTPIISLLGLALIIVPACLYLAQSTDKSQMQALMLVGTVLWFASAPIWMGDNRT